MKRDRRRSQRKRHNRRRASDAKQKRDKLEAIRVSQVPVTAADLKRLGKYALEEVRAANAEKLQKRLVGSSSGTVYYKLPTGQMIRSTLKARSLSDGTLRPIPPDPQPSKRERAKAKRQLKRTER